MSILVEPTHDLETLFQKELHLQDTELRRAAALATLHRLHLNNRLTVEQFLADLQRHKDLWAVASTMGILDFVAILVGTHAAEPAPEKPRRTRLSEEQKSALKLALLRVLGGYTEGMSRADCATAVYDQGLMPSSIDPAELASKLRQPLEELVTEGKLHTVGEKRRMRYFAGPGPKRK